MTGITTHVLDTSRGRPAAGVAVTLWRQTPNGWTEIAAARTDQDGRAGDLLRGAAPAPGTTYRLRFDTGAYFREQQVAAFYPYADIVFTTVEARHHHVPLLLSPFGYSTYRGS